MIKLTDLVDDDVAEIMDDVNWLNVSELEARNLGATLAMFRDVQNDTVCYAEFRNRTIYFSIIISIICAVNLLTALSTLALSAGIITALITHNILNSIHLHVAMSLKAIQKAAIIDEIKILSKRHPMIRSSDDEDIDVEITEE